LFRGFFSPFSKETVVTPVAERAEIAEDDPDIIRAAIRDHDEDGFSERW
jgi:hypothetical protein